MFGRRSIFVGALLLATVFAVCHGHAQTASGQATLETSYQTSQGELYVEVQEGLVVAYLLKPMMWFQAWVTPGVENDWFSIQYETYGTVLYGVDRKTGRPELVASFICDCEEVHGSPLSLAIEEVVDQLALQPAGGEGDLIRFLISSFTAWDAFIDDCRYYRSVNPQYCGMHTNYTGDSELGCCSPSGNGAIFHRHLTAEGACDNVYGVVTTEEACEAAVGTGTITVIG